MESAFHIKRVNVTETVTLLGLQQITKFSNSVIHVHVYCNLAEVIDSHYDDA